MESVSNGNTQYFSPDDICSKYLIMPNQQAAPAQAAPVSVPEPQVANLQSEPDQFVSANEQQTETQAQKPKNNKKSVKVAVAAGSAVIAVTLLSVLTKSNAAKKKLSEFIKNASQEQSLDINFAKMKKQFRKNHFFLGKSENLGGNFTSFKDCFLLPILNKVPGMKQISEIYRKACTKTTKSGYNSAKKAYGAFDDEVKKLIDNLGQSDKNKALELINERNKHFEKYFGANHVEDSRKTVQDMLCDPDNHIAQRSRKKFKDVIKGLFNKNTRKDSINSLGNTYIAEDMLKNEKQKLFNILAGNRKNITKKDKELLKLLQKAAKNDPKLAAELKNVEKLGGRASKRLNKAIITEGNDFFDKMRDIEIGCAPTDMLFSVITPAVGLGVYMHQAKTKEEKTEVALTTGIPLALGISAAIGGTLKMFTGVKALAFGAATTLVANKLGQIVNKKYQEKHNIKDVQNTIPTIDSQKEQFREKIGI